MVLFLLPFKFSYQREMMVSLWSLRDSKSPQISRIHLIVLADLRDHVVWMVPTRLLFSKSSSLHTNPLVTVSRSPITNGTPLISCSTAFSIPWLSQSTDLSFHFLSILLCDQPIQQRPQFGKFSFFLLLLQSLVV